MIGDRKELTNKLTNYWDIHIRSRTYIKYDFIVYNINILHLISWEWKLKFYGNSILNGGKIDVAAAAVVVAAGASGSGGGFKYSKSLRFLWHPPEL